MKLLFLYTLRNLLTRRLTTFLTAGGMALVVFVFAAMLMLAKGLQETLVETGSASNVVVIRRSSASEVQSSVERTQASIVETQPEIAPDPEGRPLAAKELVVLINLRKRGGQGPGNVTLRGIGKNSLLLRGQVHLLRGRLPRPGSSEVIVGESILKGFEGTGLGQSLSFAMREWHVVGIFSGGRTGFSSEIWGDVDQFMQAFRRPVYSSVLFRLRNASGFTALRTRIEGDPRLTLEVKREKAYYREQSEMMASFLRILGISLSMVFSIGAITGAMITMYAAVANRTGEIGTLRALGFGRGTILGAFLVESLLLGLIGGLGGVFFAAFLQFFTVSTTNFQTFSELAFSFTLTPVLTLQSLGFALFMGFAGGVLPAHRAARIAIVEALREV